ncbi:MAG: DUF2085 domain-containing protein [Chloroflexi bacterium]|nr:DUF2085 domain-containing protein [Chloroflexota bacterium]
MNKVNRCLNRVVYVIASHWLAMVNIAIGLLIGLSFIAPLAMELGLSQLGRLLYTAFIPFCHQQPERSFFLFGPQFTYSLRELVRLVGPDVPRRYVGNTAIGFRLAICERDIGIYGGLLLAGLIFALLRERLRPLSVRYYLLLILPMVIDGSAQLLGLYESTWWLRLLTGVLFSIATVWLVYPMVEAGMRAVQRTAGKYLAATTAYR